jgi:hypothetical protein
LVIGPAHGSYPGRPASTAYRVELIDLTRPTRVTLDGHTLTALPPGSDSPGWYYDSATSTVVVDTPSLSTAHPVTVTAVGASAVNRTEPAG